MAPLTNAEKQARHRLKAKAELDDLREQLAQSEARVADLTRAVAERDRQTAALAKIITDLKAGPITAAGWTPPPAPKTGRA